MKLGGIILIPLQNSQQVYENTFIVHLRKRIQQTKSARKVIMITFTDHKGVILKHVWPSKITLNGEYCISLLKTHIRKCQKLVGILILRHDDAL